MAEATTRFRVCMNCGKAVHVDVKTCPFCRKPTGSRTPTLRGETAVQTQVRPLRARLGQIFARKHSLDSGDMIVVLNGIKKSLEVMSEDLKAIRRKLDSARY